MRKIILAAVLLGFTVSAYAEDQKPAGTAKGAAVGAVVGHETGSGTPWPLGERLRTTKARRSKNRRPEIGSSDPAGMKLSGP